MVCPTVKRIFFRFAMRLYVRQPDGKRDSNPRLRRSTTELLPHMARIPGRQLFVSIQVLWYHLIERR